MNCILKSEVINLLNNLKITDPDSISDIDKVINVINHISGEDRERVIHCCECKHFIHEDKYIYNGNTILKLGSCYKEYRLFDPFGTDERDILHMETDFCSKGEYEENDA